MHQTIKIVLKKSKSEVHVNIKIKITTSYSPCIENPFLSHKSFLTHNVMNLVICYNCFGCLRNMVISVQSLMLDVEMNLWSTNSSLVVSHNLIHKHALVNKGFKFFVNTKINKK